MVNLFSPYLRRTWSAYLSIPASNVAFSGAVNHDEDREDEERKSTFLGVAIMVVKWKTKRMLLLPSERDRDSNGNLAEYPCMI